MAWVTLAIRKAELNRQHNSLEMQDLQITRQERQMQREYSYEEMKVNDAAQKETREARSEYNTFKSNLKELYNGTNNTSIFTDGSGNTYDQNGYQINENGEFVDANGVTIPNGTCTLNASGQLVDKNGNIVSGFEDYTYDSNNGLFVDSNNQPVSSLYGYTFDDTNGLQVNGAAQTQNQVTSGLTATATYGSSSYTSSDFSDDNTKSTAYQNALSDAKEEYTAKVNDIETNAETETSMLEEEANMIETSLEEQKTKIETQMEAVSNELNAIKESISTDLQNTTIQLK